MTALFSGVEVKIPKGFTFDSEGFYVDGHGVEYDLVSYGWKGDTPETETICLETVYSKHVRTIVLEKV